STFTCERKPTVAWPAEISATRASPPAPTESRSTMQPPNAPAGASAAARTCSGIPSARAVASIFAREKRSPVPTSTGAAAATAVLRERAPRSVGDDERLSDLQLVRVGDAIAIGVVDRMPLVDVALVVEARDAVHRVALLDHVRAARRRARAGRRSVARRRG